MAVRWLSRVRYLGVPVSLVFSRSRSPLFEVCSRFVVRFWALLRSDLALCFTLLSCGLFSLLFFHFFASASPRGTVRSGPVLCRRSSVLLSSFATRSSLVLFHRGGIFHFFAAPRGPIRPLSVSFYSL